MVKSLAARMPAMARVPAPSEVGAEFERLAQQLGKTRAGNHAIRCYAEHRRLKAL